MVWRVLSRHWFKTSALDQGFALVPVIWLSALLASAAAVLATSSRLNLQSTAKLSEAAVLDTAADGLVRLTAYALAMKLNPQDGPWQLSLKGVPIRCRTGEQYLAEIRLQDQNGLIDLNLTSETLLAHYFQTVLISPSLAQELAEKTARFRDAGPSNAPAGALPAAPADAGAHSPKKEHFQSIDELDQVAPLSIDQVSRLKRYLTVHSRRSLPDKGRAPAGLVPILRSAPGQLIAGGDAPQAAARPRLLPGGRIGIVVALTHPNGSRITRQAVAEIVGHPTRPFVILDWRVLDAEADPPEPSSAPRISCSTLLSS